MVISKNTAYDDTDHEYMHRLNKRVLKYSIIKDIFYRLIYPALRNKPLIFSADAWLEALWDTKSYPIAQYTATRTFLMPGARWMAACKKRHDAPRFKVTAGDVVVARFDLKTKTVDLEIISKQNSCLYTLDPDSWNDVRKRLKEKE